MLCEERGFDGIGVFRTREEAEVWLAQLAAAYGLRVNGGRKLLVGLLRHAQLVLDAVRVAHVDEFFFEGESDRQADHGVEDREFTFTTSSSSRRKVSVSMT